MNYRQFADYVKAQQRAAQRRMRADTDDWYPHAYFLLKDRVITKPIPMPFFINADTKRMLVEDLIVPVIHGWRARAFAFNVIMFVLYPDHPVGQLINERMVDAPDESPTAGLPRFQDIDGTVEQLQVHVFDAERHEAWSAEIARPTGAAPTIPAFELLGDGADMLTGALVDPIKEALR